MILEGKFFFLEKTCAILKSVVVVLEPRLVSSNYGLSLGHDRELLPQGILDQPELERITYYLMVLHSGQFLQCVLVFLSTKLN